MKLKGSKMASILCVECHAESPKFRVYLYEGYEDGFYWNGDIPEGWQTVGDAELCQDGLTFGLCPIHREVRDEDTRIQ